MYWLRYDTRWSTGDADGWSAEDSLAELASLADTAGAEVVGAEWQRRRHPDPEWYLGKGRAAELAEAKAQTGFTLLVADDELSPKQQRALESAPSGRPVAWTNPDTGHQGTVTPTRTYQSGDTYCREFQSDVVIGGKNEKAYGTACRQPDGGWKVQG